MQVRESNKITQPPKRNLFPVQAIFSINPQYDDANSIFTKRKEKLGT